MYYYMGEPDYENPDMVQETDFFPERLACHPVRT